MKNTLKDLWYNYFSEDCGKMNSDEERNLSKLLSELDEALHATLTDEQLKLLKKVNGVLDNLNSIFTLKAFMKGVCFASKYMLEALE